jgi:hypothetical protein
LAISNWPNQNPTPKRFHRQGRKRSLEKAAPFKRSSAEISGKVFGFAVVPINGVSENQWLEEGLVSFAPLASIAVKWFC